MAAFYETTPTLENCWRSIILFGRNVASYKFALARSILDLSGKDHDFIRLEELAAPFARHLTEHLKLADRQGTFQGSRFLDACRDFNRGEISQERLVETAVRLGFNNVIDAFHVVNQRETPVRFFLDERRLGGGIRLTQDFFRLLERTQAADLAPEAEARWRLVETAWSLGLSRNLVAVEFDGRTKGLFTSQAARRVNITSCRDALNGYQKGMCFFCYDDVAIAGPRAADVDHFLPHVLKELTSINVDGVWNLVLACRDCNRGQDGKFARAPTLRLLARLHTRNEYLIGSHHPLRETLIRQTGRDEPSRRAFLQHSHAEAKGYLLHEWEPEPRGDAAF